jgi:nitronate monooxygenase
MHYVGYAPLAAAVSNAGGIGVVTALTQPSAEALREEIQKTKALLKSPDTPIGVNLTVIRCIGLLF